MEWSGEKRASMDDRQKEREEEQGEGEKEEEEEEVGGEIEN